MRLMWKASIAADNSQVFYFARLALQHKQECQECIKMNTPLEEQLFQKKVVVK